MPRAQLLTTYLNNIFNLINLRKLGMLCIKCFILATKLHITSINIKIFHKRIKLLLLLL